MLKTLAIGRLTRDPELRYTPNGKATASMRIACDTGRKEDGQNVAEFINIVCWEKLAEIVCQNLQKGRLVYVEGQLRHREWKDRDGNTRDAYEIIASTVRFLDSAKKPVGEVTEAAPGAA